MRNISLYEDEASCVSERTKCILGIFGNRQMRRTF